MLLERFKQGVLGMEGLYPHLARADALHMGISASATRCLHQQTKQALRRAKVAREQSAIGIQRRYQADPAKVMALGDHLGAYQHVYRARMDLGELALQLAFEARAVCVDTANAQRFAVCATNI